MLSISSQLSKRPSCILIGILALSGYAIEGAAFSLIAVVVLPINAAGNPVIYTLLAVWQTKVNIQSSDNIKQDIFLAFHIAALK